jgi:hypothetical protein
MLDPEKIRQTVEQLKHGLLDRFVDRLAEARIS